MNQNTNLLTVCDVATMLQLSVRTVWRMTADRRLPSPIRLNRSVRWRSDVISEWMNFGCPSVQFDTPYLGLGHA
jgi:predicted DNA-binding transcriptional regulator AlpA